MINLQNGGGHTVLRNGGCGNGGVVSRFRCGGRAHGARRTGASGRHRRRGEPDDACALEPDERSVLAHIAAEPVSIDELQRRSRLDFGHLHSILLYLTMKKQIEQLPGSLYLRS